MGSATALSNRVHDEKEEKKLKMIHCDSCTRNFGVRVARVRVFYASRFHYLPRNSESSSITKSAHDVFVSMNNEIIQLTKCFERRYFKQ